MEVSVGLIQFEPAKDASSNLKKAMDGIRKASAKGAQIICLQELFKGPYFPQYEAVENFELAEIIPGPTTDVLGLLAKELEVVLVVPLFEKRNSGVYHNTAVVIDADGALLGRYRKMHIPDDPGFSEKYYFSPGDLGYQSWETRYGTVGVLICWDQWFPEAARATALSGAQILFYPSAIGWLPEEIGTDLGNAQLNAWQTVQLGHSVANACYVAVVNRVGRENRITFWGTSFIGNHFGEIVSEAPDDAESILVHSCDLDALDTFRKNWPFYRDRRVDSYEGLIARWID